MVGSVITVWNQIWHELIEMDYIVGKCNSHQTVVDITL